MKISYNWLKEFIPEIPMPEELAAILTSVGLEVEGIEKFEEIAGNLSGLIIGEVLTCENHPAADKLKVTGVDIGNSNILQIVCGATNVGVGQKVVVAPVGSTIHPIGEKPVIITNINIRGVESNGMICAEDEIGLSNNHEGIIILPEDTVKGLAAADYFKPATDWIFEIGLTPNRIDAMSHIGVAKDVCAYLSHQNKAPVNILVPFNKDFKADNDNLRVSVIIENNRACGRYAGVTIDGIKVESSPGWMQSKLKSIGVRPVNNIVDVTNFILHEIGQPLHAYDLRAIKGNKVIIKNLAEGTPFITLDEKERKITTEDLMICNGLEEPMCFAGVFGGLESGVMNGTSRIFLESAWFDPAVIRRTSLRYNLRTDAASRFEKGVDISGTVKALQKAAMMIKEIAGGEITSEILDEYPNPEKQTLIRLQDKYLKKIAGKAYHRKEIKDILQSLAFNIESEGADSLTVAVPYNKPDVRLPADVVEEIIRIDGFDNIMIPSSIIITPALEVNSLEAAYKENASNYLGATGFAEIFTNSITNSKYYSQETLANAVKILNSLSSDLDIMRPSLMETGLESIVYNINRKNNNLSFFEFGKTYFTRGIGKYEEKDHLCLYVTGDKTGSGWKAKPVKADIYFLKGVCENIFRLCGLGSVQFTTSKNKCLELSLSAFSEKEMIAELGVINTNVLQKFEIKQPVLFADIDWQAILKGSKNVAQYNEIPKFPSVYRDLSIVVNRDISYSQIESLVNNLHLKKLKTIKLFDVFESEKLGPGIKAFAITIAFTDATKTLTDKEIDGWMNTIIVSFENQLHAEIRK